MLLSCFILLLYIFVIYLYCPSLTPEQRSCKCKGFRSWLYSWHPNSSWHIVEWMNETSVYSLVPPILDIGSMVKTKVVFGIISAFKEYEVYLGNLVRQVNSVRNLSVQLKEGKNILLIKICGKKKICVVHKDVLMRECCIVSHVPISELKCLHEVWGSMILVEIIYPSGAQSLCKILGWGEKEKAHLSFLCRD